MISTFDNQIALSRLSMGPLNDMIEAIFSRPLAAQSEMNLIVLFEDIPESVFKQLSCHVSAALRRGQTLHFQALSQGIRDALESIIPEATMRPPMNANRLVSTIKQGLTDDEIIENMKAKVWRNQISQNGVDAWKALFKNAHRPETASFEYRCHLLKPDNDLIFVQFENTVTREFESHVLVIPRQWSEVPENWSCFQLLGPSPMESQLRFAFESMWASANRKPSPIADYNLYLVHLLDAWRRLRREILDKLHRNELSDEYDQLLGLLGH
ncbi:MAG: hypothetical protein JST12_14950 [Armatimonadetes bacterium]|nr:hypothetical protein [Armatimonadota bacterium]